MQVNTRGKVDASRQIGRQDKTMLPLDYYPRLDVTWTSHQAVMQLTS